MKLLDPETGLMECRVCGAVHRANLAKGGRYVRGSWQCQHGCQPEAVTKYRVVIKKEKPQPVIVPVVTFRE
jgi:hypothetical protein